jgi:hypothetical protein
MPTMALIAGIVVALIIAGDRLILRRN